MKPYLLKIILFFAIVAVIDFGFGKGMDYMYIHAKGGEIREMNEVCLDNQYDILVMGSSRAHHHYVPSIISDSLGMSCYNAGRDGNGIILMYGMYQMVLDRYKPKLIIYDVAKGFDIYENPQDQNNTRYVSRLKPYARMPHIDKIFKSLTWQEWMKTYSSLYRYNSISLSTIRDYLFERPYNSDGYSKLVQTMDYEPTIFETEDSGVLDSLKIGYFEAFIQSVQDNNASLVCVLSPRYRSYTTEKYEPIFNLCAKYDVLMLDYYTDTTFSTHREYFKDPTHMNDNGARLFSAMLANRLKTVY